MGISRENNIYGFMEASKNILAEKKDNVLLEFWNIQCRKKVAIIC